MPREPGEGPGREDTWMEEETASGESGVLKSAARRRNWRRFRWVLWLLVMVPVVFFAVQVIILLAPRVRTEVALLDEMTNSIAVRGQVVLSSSQVLGPGGTLYYTVPAGERVAQGAEVALVFNSERAAQARSAMDQIDEEIALLTEAQKTTAEGSDLDLLLGQAQSGIYGMLEKLATGDYAGMEAPRNEMLLAANKWQVATGQTESFETQIARLAAERSGHEAVAVASGAITAPESGYFVPSQHNDRKQMNYEDLAGLSPTLLQGLLAQPESYYGSGVAGHIVTDYKWHFFTVISAKAAEKFVVGDKSLKIAFPDVGDLMLPVTVKNLVADEESGLVALELYCEYMRPEVLQMRAENAEIVFGVEKGLRIHKNALRLVDFDNDDGSKTTYKGVYVRFGNMVYFRKIEILLEDESYMLVPAEVAEGVNEVAMYDDVVVDTGGMELYDRKII